MSKEHPDRHRVVNAWALAFRADQSQAVNGRPIWVLADGIWPGDAFLELALRLIPWEQIVDAVDEVSHHHVVPTPQAVSAFYAVVVNKVRQVEASEGDETEADRIYALSQEGLRRKRAAYMRKWRAEQAERDRVSPLRADPR